MYRSLPAFIVALFLNCFCALVATVSAFFLAIPLARPQCDSLEIPLNGIDEDCDSLDNLYLHLPPYIYLLEGQDFELYFRNIVLSRHPLDYAFEVATPFAGENLGDRWAFTPDSGQIGEFPITVFAKTPSGDTLQTASATLRIAPAALPADTARKRLMLWGHSFIDQGYLPSYLLERLRKPTNPPITWHGKRVNWIDGQTHFEAQGGSSWGFYYSAPNSPFFYDSTLNLRRYFDEVVGPGEVPDWIIVHLDVSDYCFAGVINGQDSALLENYINFIYQNRTAPMLDSLRAAAPKAKIGICYTPMPNARDTSFVIAFGTGSGLADRFRWQKIVSRLLFRNTEFFAGRENEHIYLLPIHLDLDDWAEFGDTDPVHPHPYTGSLVGPSGYREIAKSMYAWLKYLQHLPGPDSTNPAKSPDLQQNMPFGFRVFPNPARERIFFDLEKYAAPRLSLRVFDLLGRLVFEKTSDKIALQSSGADLADLPAGQFLAFLENADSGEALGVRMFLKMN